MQIRLTTLALITALALPTVARAGGPVIVEEAPVIEGRVEGQKIGAAPIIIGLIVACAILCGGGDDDAPIGKPVDPCNGC
jgi:hypothetical protein